MSTELEEGVPAGRSGSCAQPESVKDTTRLLSPALRSSSPISRVSECEANFPPDVLENPSSNIFEERSLKCLPCIRGNTSTGESMVKPLNSKSLLRSHEVPGKVLFSSLVQATESSPYPPTRRKDCSNQTCSVYSNTLHSSPFHHVLPTLKGSLLNGLKNRIISENSPNKSLNPLYSSPLRKLPFLARALPPKAQLEGLRSIQAVPNIESTNYYSSILWKCALEKNPGLPALSCLWGVEFECRFRLYRLWLGVLQKLTTLMWIAHQELLIKKPKCDQKLFWGMQRIQMKSLLRRLEKFHVEGAILFFLEKYDSIYDSVSCALLRPDYRPSPRRFLFDEMKEKSATDVDGKEIGVPNASFFWSPRGLVCATVEFKKQILIFLSTQARFESEETNMVILSQILPSSSREGTGISELHGASLYSGTITKQCLHPQPLGISKPYTLQPKNAALKPLLWSTKLSEEKIIMDSPWDSVIQVVMLWLSYGASLEMASSPTLRPSFFEDNTENPILPFSPACSTRPPSMVNSPVPCSSVTQIPYSPAGIPSFEEQSERKRKEYVDKFYFLVLKINEFITRSLQAMRAYLASTRPSTSTKKVTVRPRKALSAKKMIVIDKRARKGHENSQESGSQELSILRNEDYLETFSFLFWTRRPSSTVEEREVFSDFPFELCSTVEGQVRRSVSIAPKLLDITMFSSSQSKLGPSSGRHKVATVSCPRTFSSKGVDHSAPLSLRSGGIHSSDGLLEGSQVDVSLCYLSANSVSESQSVTPSGFNSKPAHRIVSLSPSRNFLPQRLRDLCSYPSSHLTITDPEAGGGVPAVPGGVMPSSLVDSRVSMSHSNQEALFCLFNGTGNWRSSSVVRYGSTTSSPPPSPAVK